jgi:hypothetical protein
MRTRWVRLALLGIIPMSALAGGVTGCGTSRVAGEPTTHPEAIRVEGRGLAAEFVQSIDRFTFFGPAGGANLLHVVGLDRPRPTDGSYVFWGGCYTWVSPQKGPAGDPASPMGWIDSDGTKKDWPPDPAMDVGPVRRTGLARGMFSVAGPEQRKGLQELKSFRVIAQDVAEFEYTLLNRGAASVTAGAWINTAAAGDDVIAVRMPPGTEVYGWNKMSTDMFDAILGAADERGWRLMDLSKARWDGGIKVYLAPPAGSGLEDVEIAVWRRSAKAWMHRSLGAMSADQVSRLRDAGEGPVAIYYQPGKGDEAIVEAELYGPIEDIAPAARSTVRERWRIIRSSTANAAALP